MSLRERIVRSNFIIKLRSWEYWPFGIVQFPLFFYFAWLSLRSRSILFFSGSNPGIEMGGMFGESKYNLLTKIPSQYLPKSYLIKLPATKNNVVEQLKKHNLQFPLIFKPDLGERGFMVKTIRHENDIDAYLNKIKIDFIVQDLVDMPLEFGVFYTRFPNEQTGKVTSVVLKEMLTVTGNGKSTLQQLIFNKDRAKLQWETLRITHQENLDKVIPSGEIVLLVSIGNHCLGTTFLDAGYLINEQLSTTFDAISKQIEGFYFGRFDLRCKTIEDLYSGNVKIMELNGCGAEPAHIYQPGYSLLKAIKVLFIHWRNIFLIARENRKRGFTFTNMKDGYKFYKSFKEAVQ